MFVNSFQNFLTDLTAHFQPMREHKQKVKNRFALFSLMRSCSDVSCVLIGLLTWTCALIVNNVKKHTGYFNWD